jgi:hypothetical protein
VLGQHFGDGGRQGCLAVIDVPDRPDIYVRLAAIKLFLCHAKPSFACFCLSGLSTGIELEPLTGLEPARLFKKASRAAASLRLPYAATATFGCGVSTATTQNLEPLTGLEPVTSSLPRTRSTN